MLPPPQLPNPHPAPERQVRAEPCLPPPLQHGAGPCLSLPPPLPGQAMPLHLPSVHSWMGLGPPRASDWKHQPDLACRQNGHCPSGLPGRKVGRHRSNETIIYNNLEREGHKLFSARVFIHPLSSHVFLSTPLVEMSSNKELQHSWANPMQGTYLNDLSNFTFRFQFVQLQVRCSYLLVTSEKGPVSQKASLVDFLNTIKEETLSFVLLYHLAALVGSCLLSFRLQDKSKDHLQLKWRDSRCRSFIKWKQKIRKKKSIKQEQAQKRRDNGAIGTETWLSTIRSSHLSLLRTASRLPRLQTIDQDRWKRVSWKEGYALPHRRCPGSSCEMLPSWAELKHFKNSSSAAATSRRPKRFIGTCWFWQHFWWEEVELFWVFHSDKCQSTSF